jgi:hypothetical protein
MTVSPIINEAWVLNFKENTGTRYSYGTPWVRTDGVPILFLFFCCNGYTCGTRVIYKSKKTQNFFLFILFAFFLFIGRFMFFIYLSYKSSSYTKAITY